MPQLLVCDNCGHKYYTEHTCVFDLEDNDLDSGFNRLPKNKRCLKCFITLDNKTVCSADGCNKVHGSFIPGLNYCIDCGQPKPNSVV